MAIREDQAINHLIKKHGKFTVMNGAVITSARKYLDNGIYRMQTIFFRLGFLYYPCYSQKFLLNLYKKLIHKQGQEYHQTKSIEQKEIFFDAIFVGIGRELDSNSFQLNNSGIAVKDNKIVIPAYNQ